MGFYTGILIKPSPPKGGGTQVDDFTKGFAKGIFPTFPGNFPELY